MTDIPRLCMHTGFAAGFTVFGVKYLHSGLVAIGLANGILALIWGVIAWQGWHATATRPGSPTP